MDAPLAPMLTMTRSPTTIGEQEQPNVRPGALYLSVVSTCQRVLSVSVELLSRWGPSHCGQSSATTQVAARSKTPTARIFRMEVPVLLLPSPLGGEGLGVRGPTRMTNHNVITFNRRVISSAGMR